jgi:hypothetical protein
MAHGQCGKLFTLAVEEWIASYYEPVHPQLGQPCGDGIEIASGTRIQHMKLEPELASCGLQVSRYGLGVGNGGRVHEQCDNRRGGH